VQAALQTFLADGYDMASLRGIAGRIGISHSSLLHHFASKEELLAAVLALQEEEDAPRFRADEGRSLEDQWLAVLARNKETPQVRRLWASLSADASRPGHPAREYFVSRYAKARDDLAADIRDRQAAGELDPEVDSQRLAIAIIAMLDGLHIQWLLDINVDVEAALADFFGRYRTAKE
jgi:AcrR family transcriptional regulator